MKKTLLILAIGAFVLTAPFIIIAGLQNYEINNSTIYYSLTFLFWLSLTLIAARIFEFGNLTIVIIILIIGTICGGAYSLRWGSDWYTQTIIYKHKTDLNKTIEFQMQDIGAFGYNKRTIQRTKCFFFLDKVSSFQQDDADTNVWVEVNIDLNEIGLKGG